MVAARSIAGQQNLEGACQAPACGILASPLRSRPVRAAIAGLIRVHHVMNEVASLESPSLMGNPTSGALCTLAPDVCALRVGRIARQATVMAPWHHGLPAVGARSAASIYRCTSGDLRQTVCRSD